MCGRSGCSVCVEHDEIYSHRGTMVSSVAPSPLRDEAEGDGCESECDL